MGDILLIGVPGSGKGTQALKLVQQKNFFHLSTGDLFRKNLKDQTSLGLLAKSYIDKGRLVPDSITQDMIKDFIKEIPQAKNIIWDGFPRNLIQAESFKNLLKEQKRDLAKVFYFKILDNKVIDRLCGRLYAPKSGLTYHIKSKPPKKKDVCDVSGEALVSRPDDRENVIRVRLAVFYKETQPLLDYYKKQKLLSEVGADCSPAELFHKILSCLES